MVFGVVSEKLGSGVKQTWFVSWFYHFHDKVTVGKLFDLWGLSFPIYKMRIIIIASFQCFENENNTTYIKHIVIYNRVPDV